MASSMRDQGSRVLLALGDSVMWGQGLRVEQKFCHIVAGKLGYRVDNQAHSGATVATGFDPTYREICTPSYFSPGEAPTGEVPRSKPTILEQCEFYSGDPNEVNLILMDGGINDVDITKIVNPFYSGEDLHKSVVQHCYREMTTLLRCVITKFSNSRVIVTGYFPILKDDTPLSDVADFVAALLGHDRYTQRQRFALKSWLSDPRVQAMNFWRWSDEALRQAVEEANPASGKITFVKSGFGPDNALFATDALLWNLNYEDPTLPAQDPVKNDRIPQCDLYVDDMENRIFCYRGSVGHPNVCGAQTYADGILQSLQIGNFHRNTKSDATIP
jgi:hypothetical protein